MTARGFLETLTIFGMSIGMTALVLAAVTALVVGLSMGGWLLAAGGAAFLLALFVGIFLIMWADLS